MLTTAARADEELASALTDAVAVHVVGDALAPPPHRLGGARGIPGRGVAVTSTVRLGHFPTPLEPAPRLSERLGVDLLVKREDLAGLLLGGNKVRKLERLCATEPYGSADVLVTAGGVQSNHARETAAAAARLGKRAVLVLTGEPPPGAASGNLLLFGLLGAELRFVGDLDGPALAERLAAERESLARGGDAVAVVPVGAATVEGVLAWCDAWEEIRQQLAGRVPDHVVVPAGTGSTAAGLALGAARSGDAPSIWGVSVNWPVARLREESLPLVLQAAASLGAIGLADAATDRLCWDERSIGDGYTYATAEGAAALRLLAREGGLLGDLTYTAKGFAGLTRLVHEGTIAAGSTVLHVHTGTSPELYARPPHELATSVQAPGPDKRVMSPIDDVKEG